MRKSRTDKYYLSEEELKAIQSIQHELICEVDRICKKNGIRYNMVGGTMLGAIRHQGVIPWDDDADIGFLRPEYEKFREACKTDLDPEKYYIQDLRDTEGYRWGYGKLRRRDTEFLRHDQEFMPYEQGISIDLMPFDSVPDNYLARRLHFVVCFVFRKLFWSKVGCRAEKNLFVRFLYMLLQLVPLRVLVRGFQAFVDNGIKKETQLVRILTFPTPKGIYGYDRRWYTELRQYRFGDLMLPGAADYDGYLRTKYGEYMQLPPEEKRKTHPISKLRLLEEKNV